MATAQKDLLKPGSNMGEHCKELADDVAAKAREFGSTVAEKAGEAVSYVGKKADDATSAVGTGMKSVAGAIRDKTSDKGVVGAAGSAVASTLEQGGRYLEEQGLSGMGNDFTNLIRRNPLPAVLIGVGIGYLIAHALKSRS